MTFSTHPTLYLGLAALVSTVMAGWFLILISTAFWLRFGTPIWGAF